MLETTHPDVLDQGHAVNAGGLLVLLDAPHPEPHRWVRVKPGTEVHFGRAAGEDLGTLDPLHEAPHDPTLSRRHACLAFDDGGAYLVDLGSTNGTWLDGRRLARLVPYHLPHGATFQVGRSRFAWLAGGARPAPQRARGPAWLDREAFERACLTALLRAQRYERPLALMVLSEDGAHPGERVRDAPAWLAVVDPEDVLGYVGPDEWALVLPEYPLEAARVFAAFLHAAARRGTAPGAAAVPPRELRIGVTALTHATHDVSVLKAEGRDDAGLALDLDSVRLFLKAAREDRDATRGAPAERPVRARLGPAAETPAPQPV